MRRGQLVGESARLKKIHQYESPLVGTHFDLLRFTKHIPAEFFTRTTMENVQGVRCRPARRQMVLQTRLEHHDSSAAESCKIVRYDSPVLFWAAPITAKFGDTKNFRTRFYLCVQRWRSAAIYRNDARIEFRAFSSGQSSMLLKRTYDIAGVLLALIILVIPMAILALAVRAASQGPGLYWSQRVGRGNHLSSMPKLRTMRTNMPVVATHHLGDATQHLTPIGSFLRKASLDELPQLRCILKGDTSFVGPHPTFFNQDKLLTARNTAQNAHSFLPALTGWTQAKGRDELAIPGKVALEVEYLKRRSFLFNLRISSLTAIKVGATGVEH
jgi:O-antigen biosynthesis protein WbqP